MIIETRYRDITWEEARKCATDKMLAISGDGSGWDRRKGTAVLIETPQRTDHQWEYAKCCGPFFNISGEVNKDGRQYMVCPHLAEIGD